MNGWRLWFQGGLALLAVAAAPPLGAADVGELEALYTWRGQAKVYTPPLTARRFSADFARFAATADLDRLLGARKSVGDPQLGPSLKRLVADLRVKGGRGLAQSLDALAAPVDEEMVHLTLLLERSADAGPVVALARRHGGDGLPAVAGNTTVLATVPRRELEAFLRAAPARHVELDVRFEPLFGPTVGDGGKLMALRRLHEAGITGQGTTVGVIDLGFAGYSELVQQGELPRARATGAFAGSTRALDFEGGSVHGTACAEIVADVAPGAAQVLARFDGSTAGALKAMAWLRGHGPIHIVNASWSSHLRRIDGLEPLDQEVDRLVRETGVVWVNAAGNEAALTWTGPAVDRNGNGLIDIDHGAETVDFLLVEAEGPYFIHIQWDDWGSGNQPVATQDLDAYLLVRQGNEWVVWDRAEERQTGRQFPREVLSGASLPGGMAALALKRVAVNREDLRVRVAVARGMALHPRHPAYSLGSPASARQAVAVGAIGAKDRQLADYSSQGPSWDQRLKPEVSAPAGVLSQAYRRVGEERFHGTSAAAPHVSGFAALLRSANPALDGAALRQALLESVEPLGSPRPNNAYGHGLVRATAAVPAVPAAPPAGGRSEDAEPAAEVRERVDQALDRLLGQ